MEINGKTVTKITRFDEMRLSPEIQRVLKEKGYTTATPVQSGAIPYFLQKRDVIVKAPTGTGKTFAFGIPMVEHCKKSATRTTQLVLAPTRELAMQIQSEFSQLYQYKPWIHSVCLYGGVSLIAQIQELRNRPQIVVATPGRLKEHLMRHILRLDRVETVVLDEADRMLDMGFLQTVKDILDLTVRRRNLGMFSATISREVMDISWLYQRNPVEIIVPTDVENKPDIEQYRIRLRHDDKPELIRQLMIHGGYERAMVFCNTKIMADRLTMLLGMARVDCEVIHGDISQLIREKTLLMFRRGEINVLIATDVASRGLDIDNVDVVFNYDVPEETEYYIHRIGRTGRAKKHGIAYTLCSSVMDELRMDEIEKATQNEMKRLKYENGTLLEDEAPSRHRKAKKR